MSDDSQTNQNDQLAEALFAIAAASERVAEQLRAANIIALGKPQEMSDGTSVSAPSFVRTEHRGVKAWKLRDDLKGLLYLREVGDV